MAVDIPFIKDETTISIIQAVLDIAGANFQPPYSGGEQPYSASNFNAETLLQYDQPGGTASRPMAETAISQGIGSAINSLMNILMPFISAYGLILPILGVIRGIIEIICAMMNPFAVIRAVIRLFKKWIPAFISLFPPLAGIIIIISTLKLIMAVTLYILTEVVPTIALIQANIESIKDAFNSKNEAKKEAGQEKIINVIILLLNKIGVMGVLLPLVKIISLLLRLVAGYPCSKKGSKKANGKRMDITAVPQNFSAIEDSSCCDEKVCPDVIINPPSNKDSGAGLLLPAFYGELIPGFVYKLYTNNTRVKSLRKYNQSLKDQLNPQLDEEINTACPPGSDTDDCPLFKIKITSRRGGGRSLTTNCVRVRGSVVTIINPMAFRMLGSVNYSIIPNYDILVMQNMIGLACHPDVSNARDFSDPDTDLDTPLSDKVPFAAAIVDEVVDINDFMNKQMSYMKTVGEQIADDNNFPFDDQSNALDDIQNNMVNKLNDYLNRTRDALNGTLSVVSDKFYSSFDIDKTLVKADGQDFATIEVIPRDGAGADIAKNLPDGVGINVQISSDFGVVTNQRFDNSNGRILADIISTTPGTATCTAKVNSTYISEKDESNLETIKEIKVNFVADAILPKRRMISTPNKNIAQSGLSQQTGLSREREPRK